MDTQALPQVDRGLRTVITHIPFQEFSVEEARVQERLGIPGEFLNAAKVPVSFNTNFGKFQNSESVPIYKKLASELTVLLPAEIHREKQA